MGYVDFPGVILPAGVTMDYTVTGEEPDKVAPSYKPLPVSVTISDPALVAGSDSAKVVGTIRNPSSKALATPTVMMLCFEGATPTVARIGSTELHRNLEPGATTSFRVGVLSGETCPILALAGSGWPVS